MRGEEEEEKRDGSDLELIRKDERQNRVLLLGYSVESSGDLSRVVVRNNTTENY